MKNKVIAEMLGKPEYKIAEFDKDYNLVLTGDRELMAKAYMVVSHFGAIAKIGDYVWQPYGQELTVPIEIGVLSPNQCSLFARSIDFATKKARPLLPFVLFAWFDGFTEAYIITSAKDQRHYSWPEEKGNLLFSLCLNKLKEHDPDVAEQVCKFMLTIGAANYATDDEHIDTTT